ncbi:hypothetical protein ABZ684_33310 [Streptomyces sp. NPDC006995]|uniref:hypothetical protein n=1 Tax=Streptomyces sp. NPDC006995 TaxID=3156907 RepID=UPI0033EC3353
MTITNDHSDDLQPHGTPPSEPQTPDEAPSEPSRAHNALSWAMVGLSTAFCATGVALSLTGHEAAGGVLITAGAGALSARK